MSYPHRHQVYGTDEPIGLAKMRRESERDFFAPTGALREDS